MKLKALDIFINFGPRRLAVALSAGVAAETLTQHTLRQPSFSQGLLSQGLLPQGRCKSVSSLSFLVRCLVFLGMVLGASLGSPSPVQANSNLERVVGYPVNSFRDYNPRSSQFPALFEPGIALIEDGLKLPATKRADHFRRALEVLRERLDQTPRGLLDDAYFLMGFAAELSDDLPSASKHYKESLKNRARNPLVLFRLAVVQQMQKDCDASVRNLQEIRWITDEFPHEVLYQQAICQEQVGDVGGAFSSLVEVERIAPTFMPAKNRLTDLRVKGLDFSVTGRLNREVAKTVEADLTSHHSEQLLLEDPELTLARILVRRSDPLVNMEDLRRAEKLALDIADRSKFQNELAIRVLFDAQMKTGQRDAAERTLARGLSQLPDSQILLEAAQQLSIMKESGI